MAKVRVDLEELDLDTLALIEEGGRGKQLTPADMRAVVAGFLVGDDDNPLTPEEARGRRVSSNSDVKDVFSQLNAALVALQEAALPKATSSPS